MAACRIVGQLQRVLGAPELKDTVGSIVERVAALHSHVSYHHLCFLVDSVSLVFRLVPCLASLLQVKPETIHIPVDTLGALARAAPAAVAAVEPLITPFLLAVWVKLLMHPDVAPSVRKAIASLLTLNDPEVVNSVAKRVMMPVTSLLSDESPSGVREAALELLRVCLQASAAAKEDNGTPVPGALSQAFANVLEILRTSTDSNVLQSASDCLAAYIFSSPEEIVKVSVAGMPAMVALMKVLARLLGPDVPDEGALYAGVLVLAVIFKLGGHLPPEELRNLFVAVIRRLHYSAHPGLIIRLLLVIANMIHSNEERSVEVLKSVELEGYPRSEKDMPPTDRKISGLESTLRVWVAFQKFTFGKVDKAVTCLALAKLLNNPAVVGAMKGVEVPTHDDGDPSVGTGRRCMLWSPTPIPLRWH